MKIFCHKGGETEVNDENPLYLTEEANTHHVADDTSVRLEDCEDVAARFTPHPAPAAGIPAPRSLPKEVIAPFA